jgi:hypothetical protein
MSGAESLAIFGIACNVMQVISFAHETISLFKQINEDGRSDPGLHKAASQMESATKSLTDSINPGGRATTAQEKELLKVAEECAGVAKKLTEETNKLKIGTAAGLKKVAKIPSVLGERWWKKGQIERLEKDLGRAQKTMETHILIRIW